LVRQVPPQRREVASEAVTGAWGASRPSTLRRTSRQASRRTSRSLNYTRHLLHCRPYGPPCSFLVRKFPCPLFHSPLPADPIPEASQRVGMDPRDQARWLPAHCPGRTSQSRGPPDSAETAQAFPRTVYLESCYGTQCSPRSLFSHSIILAAYPLAKTPAGDRVNVRNALP
jgi:hypothetical protein